MASHDSVTMAGTRPRPPFWVKLPVLMGNLVQVAGIVVGVALIEFAARLGGVAVASTVVAIVGIVVVAFCSHSLGHWLVGRLVGLRFAFVGIRGTDHPETYPTPVRQLYGLVPMFTMVSTRRTREAAGPRALAAYYAAGQTTASIGWVLSALLARSLDVPNSRLVLLVMIVWAAAAIVVNAVTPKGDYAKARAALRAGRVA